MKHKIADTRALQEWSEKLISSERVQHCSLPLGRPPPDTVLLSWDWPIIILKEVSKILDSGTGPDGKVYRKQLRWPWACLQPWKICHLHLQFLRDGSRQCHGAVECWRNGIISVLLPGFSLVGLQLSGSLPSCCEEMTGFWNWRTPLLFASCAFHSLPPSIRSLWRCPGTKMDSGVPWLRCAF